MYDRTETGKSPVEIAQAPGRTPGTSKLILASRARKQTMDPHGMAAVAPAITGTDDV